jgi:hypothetical protein
MNVTNLLNTKAGVALVGAITIAGAAWWLYEKFLKDKLPDEDTFNPTSDKNLAYRGTNAVGAALTGDASFSLGSWLYDRFNPAYDPNQKYEPRKLEVRKESAVFDYLAGNG